MSGREEKRTCPLANWEEGDPEISGPLKYSPGIYQLVVNPGFLLDKRCQRLHFFLGKLKVTLFFLDLGQVPLKILERFPETGQYVLEGV
jgi:hypothetical protein